MTWQNDKCLRAKSNSMTKVDAKIKIKIHIGNNKRRKKEKEEETFGIFAGHFHRVIMLNVLLSDWLEVMNIFSAIHVK